LVSGILVTGKARWNSTGAEGCNSIVIKTG
jgi:hypothetical protein